MIRKGLFRINRNGQVSIQKFQERATSAPSAAGTVGGIFYVRISQEGGLLWQNIKRHQEMLVCQKMHFALTGNMSKIIYSKKSV